MSVHLIESDDGFQQELEAAGVRLVVVNFICKRYTTSAALESHFEQLSNKYPRAIFLKVDIEKCKSTAIAQCVLVPTLFFYRNKTKIDYLQNANLVELEAKIQLHIGSDNADSGEDLEQGLMDLKGLITKNQCECLGRTDNLEDVFTDGGNYLNSEFDEQLILSVHFNQSVKIHAIKLKAPEELGLTVTLVVTLRKFISLLFSIVYFNNPFTIYHWIGTLLVFLGTMIFTEILPPITSKSAVAGSKSKQN